MAITTTQQARQMYNKGSKKPVKQAGVKNFLGKQEMVTAPKFWLSEPDHVKAKLAYITDEEEKILIDKNLYGSLKGKPNKGPAGLPSLQGGDAGGLGGDGPSGDDSGGDARSDYMGSKGKKAGPAGLSDKARGDLEAMTRGLRSSISAQNRAAAVRGAINKVKNFLPGGKFSLTGVLGNVLGPKGFNPDSLLGTSDYQGAKGPSSVDDDDGGEGEGQNILQPIYNPMTTAASMMNPMTPKQGIGALDLNRIAYRFMADGGFLGDEDEARQAYGLGSIVKKVVKKATTIPRKLIKTVKKVAKSPTGRLLLAVAAPYALGPAMAGNAAFLGSLSAAQKAALISGATTGITQLASGEDLDFKDIAVSAALGGASAKMFPGNIPGKAQATPFERQAFSAAQTQGLGSTGLDPSTLASRARVASDVTPKNTSFLRDSFMGSRGKGIADVVSTTTKDPSIFTRITEGLGNIKDSKFTDILLRNKETGKLSPLKLAGLAGLAGLATAKGVEQEEPEEMDRGPGIDIAAIRRRPFDYMAPRFAGSQFDFYAAEGGQAKKEPVAKKVMPLLDMGGMEKDYRAEGGFVPIGRMEKADDVPARLSKNEFVFTADAVRNAGDGDVDKGAEVMYNMMKNLEAGGDVSEESQGLEGARRMFQTSQRLEEVL